MAALLRPKAGATKHSQQAHRRCARTNSFCPDAHRLQCRDPDQVKEDIIPVFAILKRAGGTEIQIPNECPKREHPPPNTQHSKIYIKLEDVAYSDTRGHTELHAGVLSDNTSTPSNSRLTRP